MPALDDTAFGCSEQIATTTASGHAAASSSGRAIHVAASSPPDNVTKPPYSERAADADARRASIERSTSDMCSPSAASIAVISAAKPDADDARPAAVGKLLSVSMRNPRRGRRLRVRSADRDRRRSSRRARPCRSGRRRVRHCSASTLTRVRVRSCDSVIDSDGVAGTLSGPSRLPQYFTSAMFGCASAMACIEPQISSPAAPGTRSRAVRESARPRWSRGRRIPDR